MQEGLPDGVNSSAMDFADKVRSYNNRLCLSFPIEAARYVDQAGFSAACQRISSTP